MNQSETLKREVIELLKQSRYGYDADLPLALNVHFAHKFNERLKPNSTPDYVYLYNQLSCEHCKQHTKQKGVE